MICGGRASAGDPDSELIRSDELQPHSNAVREAANAIHRLAVQANELGQERGALLGGRIASPIVRVFPELGKLPIQTRPAWTRLKEDVCLRLEFWFFLK